MNNQNATKAEMAYRVMARKDPQTGKLINCPVVVNGRKVSVEQLLEEVASNGHGIGKVSALKGAYFVLMSVVRDHLLADGTGGGCRWYCCDVHGHRRRGRVPPGGQPNGDAGGGVIYPAAEGTAAGPTGTSSRPVLFLYTGAAK